MGRVLVSLVAAITLFGSLSSANAHGWRGGYAGGGWHGAWAPFAAGAFTGAIVAGTYYRPHPVYYGPPVYPQTYYYPPQNVAAFCPENGLFYPQTQVCPSGWQKVLN